MSEPGAPPAGPHVPPGPPRRDSPGGQPPFLTSAQRVAPPQPKRGLSPLDIAAALVVPVVLAVLLIAYLVVPSDGRSSGSSNEDGKGLDGAGDPYFPGQGGQGYDVQGYDIDLLWDGRVLTGQTTVTAVATEKLPEVHLDLQLPPESVQVNGAEASFAVNGPDDLAIEPERDLAQGSTFTVTVQYGGDPGQATQRPTDGAWWRTRDTVTAVGEPYVASWWFPANDHPSDPATMDVTVTVPAGVEALSTGTLVSRDEGSDDKLDTWHWRNDQPTVTYANFLTIGQYEIRQGQVKGKMTASRPFLYAVSAELPEDAQAEAFRALEKTPRWVAELEEIYGPYPVSEIGGVVPPHDLWFGGMETVGRPIYNARSLLSRGYQDQLVIHEMAHMWFGDSVNLSRWSDLFLNEGYASHAEWLVRERNGGDSADTLFTETFKSLNPLAYQIPLDNPGANTLFDTVYERGPMALQALRNVMGDEAFVAFGRAWAARRGPQSIEAWFAAAQQATSVDLKPWRDAWLSGTGKPKQDPAIGFPK